MNDGSARGVVSVVICVYNAGSFLRASVDSILAQTYTDLEILVVDDGSTDGCFASLNDIDDPRVRILRQNNGGKPVALNQALRVARGEFYAVHDADDLSHPSRIARQVDTMRQYPETAAVFCGYELILNDHHLAPKFGAKDATQCRRDIDRMHMPGHDPTAMYRMSMVRGLMYDEELPIVEGFDYVLRVGERFDMRVIGECLYSYRIHWNTVTKRDPSKRNRMLRNAVEKAFARRGLTCDESRLPQLSPPNGKKNRNMDNDIVSHFMASIVDLRRARRWSNALRAALRCAVLHPLDPYYYKPAVFAVTPLSVIDWHRAKRGSA
jgi:glycosyltransferase involved in cell wall biosynthesis